MTALMKICPTCGTEYPDSERFCPKDGAALKTQGVSAVGDLTYDKSRDDIVSVAGGVVGVRRIDWQNRPTFQQVVQFTGHR